MSAPERPSILLPALVAAQFAGTSLWFAGNAILPDIQAAWALPDGSLGWVTSAVQLGFIVGTLLSAIFTLSDRVSAPRLFFAASLSGAVMNLGPLMIEGLWPLLGFRFLTGVALAGIYPVGMKLAASWYREGLGAALGWLVGALVLGTAAPHLVRALGDGMLAWQAVLAIVSALAVIGGVLVLAVVGEGPMTSKSSAGFNPRALGALLRVPRFRAAALGYFGHMWELYAFWAFVPAILASYATRQQVELPVSWVAFAVIASGALGCIIGGKVALRKGSARVAAAQVLASGALALTAPLWSMAPTPIFVMAMLVWGVFVVGDSPQFSTLNALTAPRELVGSGLTIVTSIGFGVTIISIELISRLARDIDILWLLPVMALGPVVSLIAMRTLVASDPSLERQATSSQ
jgi:MFS family permease